MVLLWRIWLRAALVMTMALGCNITEPALASVDATPAFHMMSGCHVSPKGGGTALGCHACLAVPIRVAQVEPPLTTRRGFAPSPADIFAGRGFAPAIPPPRSA